LSEIETLVAEFAPRPDVPASVRKLPSAPMAVLSPETSEPAAIDEAPALSAPPPTRRPVIQVTAPQRYRVQFTMGEDTHDKLRRLQTLMRREIPDGDVGAI